VIFIAMMYLLCSLSFLLVFELSTGVFFHDGIWDPLRAGNSPAGVYCTGFSIPPKQINWVIIPLLQFVVFPCHGRASRVPLRSKKEN
jgi:hypothetical protein